MKSALTSNDDKKHKEHTRFVNICEISDNNDKIIKDVNILT